MEWPDGFFIGPRLGCADVATVAALRDVPTTIVADSCDMIEVVEDLTAFHGDQRRFAGPALTVQTRAGDNLMIHKALQLSKPGDVLVIDGASSTSKALVGGLMRATALAQGVAAIIVAGAIRDLEDWLSGDLPVYAMSPAVRGPTKTGPGRINVPICIGKAKVSPGDLVLGDADGIVVLPRRTDLSALLAKANARIELEADVAASNRANTTDWTRIDRLLQNLSCPTEPDKNSKDEPEGI